MQLRRTSAHILAAVLSLGISLLITGTTQGQTSDDPLDMRPYADVDDELFLVHGLRVIYTNWPEMKDSGEMTVQIANLRAFAMTLRDIARANRTDQNLIVAYDDSLALLDKYEICLNNIGAINRRSDESAQNALQDSLLDGAGKAIKSKVLDNASDKDAINGAAFDVFLSMLKNGFSISQERQAAIQASKQQFSNQSNSTMAAAEAMIQRLSRERGWRSEEFDLGSEDSLSEQSRRRSRDPFALYALALANDEHETAASAETKAEYCLRAARLVPASSAFNGFRRGFLSEALSLSLYSDNIEKSYYSGPIPSAGPDSLRLARTYLALDPNDENGYGHMQLSRALAFNGRFKDAVIAANEASNQWRNDAAFEYRYAKLLSLTGVVDESADALALAYRLGWNDVNDARNNPDFASLQRSRTSRFAELTTVRVRPAIQFHPGWMDDILVRNDSPFELTNLKLQAVISNQGQTYRPQVFVKSLKPGQTYTASGVTAILGNHYDTFTYTMSCDQCQ
jgi:hypothetical protein